MPTSNCIDSTPKIEAALQEQHQCPSPFHYRPTIYEELNDYSAAFDDGKVQRPVCIGSCCMECATVGLWPEGKTSYNKRVQIFLHLASLPFWLTCLIYELMRPNRSQRCTQSFLIVMITGHVMNGLAALIEAPLRGETCSRTIYSMTAFFNPLVAVVGFVCTTGVFLCFLTEGFFLAHMAERIVIKTDYIERYYKWAIAFTVTVALAMAIGFTASSSFQLGPTSLAPFTFDSVQTLVLMSFSGVFILGGFLCILIVIGFLMKSAFEARVLYHSASKATSRAIGLLLLQWRTFVLSFLISLIWVLSLVAYIKTKRFSSLMSGQEMPPVFVNWVMCLFSTYDRASCQAIIASETKALDHILVAGLMSGVYHTFMPFVFIFRSSVFDVIEHWPFFHRFFPNRSKPETGTTGMSFAHMTKAGSNMSHSMTTLSATARPISPQATQHEAV
ncbi:hypothetical protein CXG81DRAFT_18842 [Caulochytrium protostelioides]|uniref:Uncharacterized protein n=1 Tax=Caulochytrium protostelioides TaxID=1555241 RepID=A0A4P9X802_9FUNG|nr:hypothetical protein CXG81DRAFT_18842 [Caulochytrium protostelioides]|eukprot:RKP01368.1 hypothetical protein CXG81DRAFT_18842 [Caulochytrium protostelioides]